MKKRPAFFHTFASAILFISGVSVAPCILVAQAPTAKLSFDVATIKPSAPLDRAKLAADMQAGKMPRLGPHISASRAEYIYMPLKELIASAYNVKNYQIDGPEWLSSERFDIEGTFPDGATKDDAPAMLRTLLEERFKLASHRDTGEHKVLALVEGKGGPKMKTSTVAPQPIDETAPLKPNEMIVDGPDGPMRMSRNHDGSMTFDMGAKGTLTEKLNAQDQALRLDSSMVTMAGFADTLSAILAPMGGEQVVDMTGLKGNYEVAVEISLADIMAIARTQGFAPPPSPGGGPVGNGSGSNAGPAAAASDPAGGASIFRSVSEIGLKLEERKAQVTQLVIDHIEKAPTEN
jgi:uncharacterized protein (TIGR03435 family)